MKKIFLILILGCFVLTGCGGRNEKEILQEFEKKVNDADAYYLTGNMELTNNEDVYTYKIMVSYQKEDNYKIELTNVINDHKQVILRNKDGVYIITPSLNKSFKFQSDWPYNNSQVYLLDSLLDDIKNDDKKTFEDSSEGYIFTSTVNYPNNEKLVKQKVYFNKDYLPKMVEVIDSDGNVQIKMVFDKIDLKVAFNDTYFDLNSILDTQNGIQNRKDVDKTKTDSSASTTNDNNNNNSNNNLENQEPNNENGETKTETKQTATIDDIIYPMYLPVNTYLTGQKKVATDDGERLILTFTGDKSFVLVEETVKYTDMPEIIPTYGNVELIGPSLAVVNDNSANWFNNGIEYYVVSDVMNTDELLQVVKSISVLPVSK